jgi:ribosome biogenesis GTPase / thiamine phosphate phosphatase
MSAYFEKKKEVMQLFDLGWGPFFEDLFVPYRDQGLSPMRITRENRRKYLAFGELGEYSCEISGRFRFETDKKGEFPTVGDWVAVSTLPDKGKAIIQALLPRKTAFSRKVAGQKTEEQIVAANIDVVFIVCGLDLNFNLRRIERYLTVAWESGALPVILLNKADLCPDADLRKGEVESIALGAEVHSLSASKKTGLEALFPYIQVGKTVAFLGSSGVGKSTIINALLGAERLRVNSVSELGSRGRHTTTFRELLFLPNGGMVIDTPGMRELQVWGDEEGLKRVFDDIESLASQCRFWNCRHENEPGCAVQEAIIHGSLEPKRLESFWKLKKELAYLADRQTMTANAVEKARWKSISQIAKNLKKNNLG